MKPVLIIGIGEMLWDVLPEGKRLGGAPCNFAYHAQKLGARSYIISAVGNDEDGKEILSELEARNISTELIQVNDKMTGVVDVSVNEKGVPNYTIHENVAWDYIGFNELIQQKVKEANVICFGSLAQRSATSRETIEKVFNTCNPEKWIVFDINLRQHYYNREILEKSLQWCNVLKLNEEELPELCRNLEITVRNEQEQIEKIIKKYGLKLVAFTKGSEGSYLFTPAEESYIATPKVKVRDTVGAGDSFTAAMIVGFANGDSLKRVHEKAVQLSAYVCTQQGAMPEYN